MRSSAPGSEAFCGSSWLDLSEGSLPLLLGTVVGVGKLGDPALAGTATGVVGAAGSFAGVALGTSAPAFCIASGALSAGTSSSPAEGSPDGSADAPPGSRADAVDKALGGS